MYMRRQRQEKKIYFFDDNLKRAKMSVVSVENTNTRRSVDKWVNVYKKWATQQSINQDLEDFDGDDLDLSLIHI